MSGFGNRPKSPLPRGAAADLWRHTLSQIPSLLGRLIYLSSLRDPNSSRYQHHGLAAVFGDDEAHAAMERSHEECFAQWLEFGLEDQKSDLEMYFAGLEEDKKQVVATWSRIHSYRNLPPQSALAVERDLFAGDLEILLTLLRNELGVSFSDPTASRLP